MRRAVVLGAIFALLNVAMFIILIRMDLKSTDYALRKNEEIKKNFMSEYSFGVPQSLEDYYKETGRFSVVIVTHKEPLLERTYPIITVINILNNTRLNRLQEIVIVDDMNDPPITWNPDPSIVRIVRSNERLGLIRARIAGGNAAKADFIVFLDAHCRVSPTWLETPYKLLKEDNRTIVNFVDFIMDENFKVKPAGNGIGSSATIQQSLKQTWGGGSLRDDFTPITMGMFAITRYWWKQGEMDPALQIWGGENVEISFRTWLCGGRIVVARDSYVAHYFRTKPGYSYDATVVTKNYIRIAHIWLDEPSLKLFYQASHLMYHPNVIPGSVGNISDRLRMKEELHCKPFSDYLKRFKGRTFCDKKDRSCGGVYSVKPSDIKPSLREIFNLSPDE